MKPVGILSLHAKSILVLVLSFTACSLLSNTAQAEMPPSAYRSFQAAASEVLEVEITAVEQSTAETKEAVVTSVVLAAKMLKVRRTASKLKAGSTITIKYDRRKLKIRGWVGPSQVPIMEKGETCPAYLKRTDNKGSLYEPAAGGYTFQTVNG